MVRNIKIRKTISIEYSDLKSLKPFLDATGNNLSLALRKLIESYNEKVNNSSISDSQQKLMMLRSQVVDNRIAELIPGPLIRWMLKMNPGVPPLGVFRVIIEKMPKLVGLENVSISDYIQLVGIFKELFGFQIHQHIEHDPDFKKIKIFYEADDYLHLRGTVINFSSLLAHDPFKLKIIKIIDSPTLFIVDCEPCSSEEEAFRSVKNFFGDRWLMLEEIQKNLTTWNHLVKILRADHYEDVILNREILLQIIRSNEFSYPLSNMISNIYGVSVEDTGYQEITRMIEEVFISNGILDRIESNNDEMKIFYKFDDDKIINTVNETILRTLQLSGQAFTIKKNSKITIMNRLPELKCSITD